MRRVLLAFSLCFFNLRGINCAFSEDEKLSLDLCGFKDDIYLFILFFGYTRC